ncbi:PGF-pre-PGF domain-containing protein [Methanosarcina sp. T3]|uniref:PGF-pre-PGF domain-containing protein n=1 Tax=Methanosarcina sp. T3 TaxID=3439062 RepID=UPI003F85F2C7
MNIKIEVSELVIKGEKNMKSKRKFHILPLASATLILFLMLISFTASTATAEIASPEITETRITTDGSNHYFPAVYGNRIIWEDERNGRSNIYMYDISTSQETQITTNESYQLRPDIYGDWIVWKDGNDNIYTYDLSTSTETLIPIPTTYWSVKEPLKIYGNRIVWAETPDLDNWNICMYDLSNSTYSQITGGTSSNYDRCDIYSDNIVWSDFSNGSSFVYNISTSESQFTTYGRNPAIYGDRIVLESSDIVMYNLSTSEINRITSSMGLSGISSPNIYADRIVWMDRRNGNWDIYMYDISTSQETQITTNESDQFSPAIYDDIIVWEDLRNGNRDIYMCNLSKDSTKPSHPVANFSTNVRSGYAPLSVLFTDTSQNATELNWDFGDGNSSTNRNTAHIYSVAGNYTTNLTVRNENGTDWKTAVISVLKKEEESEGNETENETKILPVVAFSTNVTSGYYPLTVLFTDTSQNATSRSWDVNNDGVEDSNGASFAYTYTSRGTYEAKLTAINANGTSSETDTITVLEVSSSEDNNESNNSDTSNNDSVSDDSTKSSDSSHSSGSSHSSSSGGGAGGSPEPAKNVASKEISQVFITNGKPVVFNFPKNATCVEYITFEAKKTAGKTTTIVEELKAKSTLVSNIPEGEVYKSFNVWVGNSGYGDSDNILNASINFKVNNAWIQENDINQSSIVLYKYDDESKKWIELPVTLTGEDGDYLYFTAETPGYYSFVITGEKEESPLSTEPTATFKGSVVNDSESAGAPESAEDAKAPGFGLISGVIYLFCMFLYRKNKTI